jgi:hypothetical protein
MIKILIQVMKEKIIELIRILGLGLTELIVDFDLDTGKFDSIEWNKRNNKIYLHIFLEDDVDISVDFDDLPEEDQIKIYKELSVIWN